MKLILERTRHGIYAYFEDKEHFKRVQATRGKRLKNPKSILDNECNLFMSLNVGEHMVFDVKKGK
jgi:hypothetical protein